MNILWYVMDSVRADHLSALGYRRPTTPHLDRLASQGVLCTQAFAHGGWTLPSAAAMLSGARPQSAGIRQMHDRVSTQVPWLPEHLSQQGYRTVAVTSMYQTCRVLGFARGFDDFLELFRDPALIAAAQADGSPARGEDYCLPLSEDIHQAAIDWIDAEAGGDQPFFMLVWSIDAHEPYRHPHDYNRDLPADQIARLAGTCRPFTKVRGADDLEQLVALYDGSLRYQDAQLGRLLEQLEARGILDETLIIVTSDHGEMFFEHGLAGHGKYPWDAELHVPIVLRCPQVLPTGVRIDALVDTLDLAPTIVDLVGVEPEPRFAGESLRPLIEGTAAAVHNALVLEVPLPFSPRESAWVVRTRDWKLIEYMPPECGLWLRRCLKEAGRCVATLLRPGMIPLLYGRGGLLRWCSAVVQSCRESLAHMRGQPTRRLYHLATDPGETCDVAHHHPQVVAELAAVLATARATDLHRPSSQPIAANLGPQRAQQAALVERHLAQLGYIER